MYLCTKYYLIMATKIFINDQEAVLQSNASFEYVSENPLFTEAEDYTFEIPFPLKDCPRNISIFGPLHVKGVDISKVSYPCEIRTDAFSKVGILTITSVSHTEVSGQFLEGGSKENFLKGLADVYITDLDFSDYDGSDGTVESVQRVSGDGWANMIVWDSNKETAIYFRQGIAGVGGWSCRHIYLYYLVRLVALKCGFSIDDSALMSIPIYSKVCVVNTVYAVYDRAGYNSYPSLSRALPHWTVKDFLKQVAEFFGCVVQIDSISSSIKFYTCSQYSSLGNGAQKIILPVSDDFTVELEDGDGSKYKGNVRYKIPDTSDPDKLNRCTWLNKYWWLYSKSNKTLQELKAVLQEAAWGVPESIFFLQNSKDNVIHLVDKDIDVVLTNYEEWSTDGYDQESMGLPEYLFCEFEPLGQYGDLNEGVELGIVPCPLKMKRIWTKPTEDCCPGLEVRTSTYSYRMPIVSVPTDGYVEFLNNDQVPIKEILDVIKGGEVNETTYFDCLWVVLHSGVLDQRGHYLNTRKLEPAEDSDYDPVFKKHYLEQEENGSFPNYNCEVTEHEYNLVPTDPSISEVARLPKVDETKLYRYRFLSKTLPDSKAIYVIKGKEYICLRLTAHFNIDGMSELIEGEFYEIVG